MDSTQTIVGVGGLGLVAVNFWTSSQRQRVGGVLFSGASPADAHQAILGIAGELLLVGILYIAAGTSQTLGRGMAALIAALWVLWGIQFYSAGARNARPGVPYQGAPGGPHVPTSGGN